MDLPEPKPRVSLSPGEIEDRKWTLLKVLNFVLLLYSLVHKAGIPLLRNLDAYQKTSVDWFWLYYVVLSFILHFKKKTLLIPFASVGLAYCALRLFLLPYGYLLLGQRLSWEFVSIFMTEGLTAAFLLYVLKTKKFGFDHAFQLKALTILLAAGIGFVWAFFAPVLHRQTHTRIPSLEAFVKKDLLPSKTEGTCGLTLVRVDSNTVQPQIAASNIRIEDCGFFGGLFFVTQDIVILNATNQFLNIHMMGWKKDHPEDSWVFLKNAPIFQGKSIKVEYEQLRKYSLVKLFSDSWPQAGLAVLVMDRSPKTWSQEVVVKR